MTYQICLPIQSLTLVVPVAPCKGAALSDLLDDACAGMVLKIRSALSPASLSLVNKGDPNALLISKVHVCPSAQDNGYAARVVNVQISKSAKENFCFEAGQGIADLLNAPVRLSLGQDFLTALGRDIVMRPGETPSQANALCLQDLCYRCEHGSLFNGPQGEAHRTAVFENLHARTFVYGDRQQAYTPRPSLPGCMPGVTVPDSADLD